MLRWRVTPASSGLLLASSLLAFLACNDLVDEEVPPEVCVSGKRWIGGDRGSPNMYPGRDCVGCHKDNGAPELILGGTYYGAISRQEGEQGEDCFGAEGVKITITAGDGQTYETVTNEAGNFWFAARDTDIVMPYTLVSEYLNPLTGLSETAGMVGNTRPSYGGCARCHSRDAESTPFNSDDPDYVDPSEPEYVFAIGQMGSPANTVPEFLEFIAGGRVTPDPE